MGLPSSTSYFTFIIRSESNYQSISCTPQQTPYPQQQKAVTYSSSWPTTVDFDFGLQQS